VAFGDAAFRVRRPADEHALVPDVDVGMVVLSLRDLRDARDERNRGGEALELELAHERVLLLAPSLRDAHAPDYAGPEAARGVRAALRARLPAGRPRRGAGAPAAARAAARSCPRGHRHGP